MADLLKSARLIYRPIEESDDAFLMHMQEDSQANLSSTGWLPRPQGKKNAVEHREYFNTCLLAALICLPPSSPDTFQQLVAASHEKKPIPIGTIALTDNPKERHHRNTIMSINIAHDFRGKGYGSEAIRWGLEWAFQRAGMHKVSLWCYQFNTEALRLYRKLGFVEEARLREQIWHDGQFWDDCGFSMLDREWREKGSNGSVAKPYTTSLDEISRAASAVSAAISVSSGNTPHFGVPTPATNGHSAGGPLSTNYQLSSPVETEETFEFHKLKDNVLTVAELWKEWHEGFPEEGRPSVEWMEKHHNGRWRHKRYGAPGSADQFFSQRKRIIDEVKRIAEGDAVSQDLAIELLDARVREEGMPTLNKLAEELKKEQGVKKRRRSYHLDP